MGIIGGGVGGAFYFMEKQAKVQAETALEAVRPETPHLLIIYLVFSVFWIVSIIFKVYLLHGSSLRCP